MNNKSISKFINISFSVIVFCIIISIMEISLIMKHEGVIRILIIFGATLTVSIIMVNGMLLNRTIPYSKVIRDIEINGVTSNNIDKLKIVINKIPKGDIKNRFSLNL